MTSRVGHAQNIYYQLIILSHLVDTLILQEKSNLIGRTIKYDRLQFGSGLLF